MSYLCDSILKTMKIAANQIYFIIPLYAECGDLNFDDSLWEANSPRLDDSALYSFVDSGRNALCIYRLKAEGKSNVILQKFLRRTSTIEIRHGVKREVKVRVLNDNRETWCTPRLVLAQSRRVGLLSIPMEVIGPQDVADIVDFNYAFHKFDSGQGRVLTLTGNESQLLKDIDSHLGLRPGDIPYTWTLAKLVNLLLADSGKYREFTPRHAHVFTYISAEDASLPLSQDDRDTFLRLMHCQNSKYLPVGDAFNSESVKQTFANIFTGISVEGGCMLGLLTGTSGDSFIAQFPSDQLQNRYLWLYFMALMQRHTLLNVDRTLAAESIEEFSDEKINLNIARICRSRLKGFFTSISSYSHINDVYTYFNRSLGVDRLYDEITGKLQVIDTWLKAESTRRQARFEQFIKECGVVMAVLALLYGVPQALTATSDAYAHGLWPWAWLSLLPAVAGLIWIIVFMIRRK